MFGNYVAFITRRFPWCPGRGGGTHPQAVAKPLYGRVSGWRRREGQGAGAGGWVVGGEAARGGGGAVTCAGGGEAASPPGSDRSPAEWLRPERTVSRTEE